MIDENGNLHERIQELYVSETYKVFLLTGQADGTSRCAYVVAKPFNTFTAAEIDRMKDQAQSCEPESESSINLVTNSRSLMVSDKLTGTATLFPLGNLDDDVKARLSYTGAAEDRAYATAWDQYVILESVALERDVEVSKPLQLKQVRKPRGFIL